MKEQKLRTDIQKMRVVLILWTAIEIGYLLFNLFGPAKMITFLYYYKMNWVLWGLNYGIAGVFIFYTWKYFPLSKKEKTNHTLMILFLGIIGMWLWLPNEKEIKRLSIKLVKPA